MSPDPPSEASQPHKSQRILACILCKQRKVKCDRKFPCAVCVKAGVQCVPASLIQPQRRRRRFPERELLNRVRKYEDLLRQNNIDFEPLHKDSAGGNESPNVEGGSESEDEHMEEATSEVSALSPADKLKPNSEARTIWQHIRNAVSPNRNENEFLQHLRQARDPNVEDDAFTEEARDAALKKAWESAAESADHLLFGLRKSTVDLSAAHPDPLQIFRLWQIYLENVNPLLKVTHTPSLQGRIIEAASNIANIGHDFEALMFGIYSMAILSLDAEDCQVIFSTPKQGLLTKYQYSCQQALLNCAFLRTHERDCLTALYLYLLSLRQTTIPPSLHSMLGVAIRIAQRMGIHSEILLAKCSPLEAEMRRRLWWSLVLFDTRMGELSNTSVISLDPTWNCKIPLNVNDTDLRPEMKVAPTVQGKCTDAIFAVLRSELGDFTRHAAFHLDFTNPALRPMAKRYSSNSNTESTELNKLEESIEEQYLKHCDQDNPIHYMTIWTTRARIAKCRLLEHHSRHAGPNVNQTDSQRDAANSYAIRLLECDTMIMKSPLIKGFRWLNLMFFPFPSYIHLSQDLRKRSASRLAQKAWDVMSESFDAWCAPLSTENVFFQAFAKVVLQAWDACEAATKQSGDSPTPPRIVTSIRSLQDQTMQYTPNTDTEQFDLAMGFDADDFSIPVTTPMNFTNPNMAYNMTMPDNYPMVRPELFPSMSGQAPFNPHMHRFAWTAFGGMPSWRGP